MSVQLYDIAKAIWRETYRHDCLLEWHEIKVGTMHYKRVMAAAESVKTLFATDISLADAAIRTHGEKVEK